MKSRSIIAAVVTVTATASLAGALWLGDQPETSADTPPTLAAGVTVPEAGGEADTLTRSARPAGDAPDAGSGTYRSLSPEVLTPVQQASGTRCETESGTCTVPPQPIGSTCQCGEGDSAMWGQITR